MKSKSTLGRTLFATAMVVGAMSAFTTPAQAGEWHGHKKEKHRHQKHYVHNHYRPVVVQRPIVVHRPVVVHRPRVVYYAPQPIYVRSYEPWGWNSYSIVIR